MPQRVARDVQAIGSGARPYHLEILPAQTASIESEVKYVAKDHLKVEEGESVTRLGSACLRR